MAEVHVICMVFLVLMTANCKAFSSEPKCPEYNILENLLEKLVRMEHKMEVMHDDMHQEQDAIRKEGKETAERLGDLERTVDIKTLQALEERLAEAETTVASHGTSGAVSAFTAYLDRSVDLDTGDAVVFDKTLTNIGDHYSTTTGQFTAPTAGAYLFSWHTQAMDSMTSCLSVNGSCKVHAYANGKAAKGDILPDGNSAILELEADDHVWIEVQLGSKLYSNSGQKWIFPTFTGHSLF